MKCQIILSYTTYEEPGRMSTSRADVDEARVANIYDYEIFSMWKQGKFFKKNKIFIFLYHLNIM